MYNNNLLFKQKLIGGHLGVKLKKNLGGKLQRKTQFSSYKNAECLDVDHKVDEAWKLKTLLVDLVLKKYRKHWLLKLDKLIFLSQPFICVILNTPSTLIRVN